jgi:uncharacterized protein YprB with RNaseH-like and TPR domain
MLTNTFVHIPGVGEKTEQRLWGRGIHCWADAMLDRDVPPGWRPHLEQSLQQLAARNPAFFAEQLAANQQWRLYRDFQDRCAFVDIETTGLGPYASITTIALYDGRSLRTYVRGQNLDQFGHDIAGYQLLVSYNGKSFDVPIIERGLGVRMPRAHIDLRHVLRGLGLTGGLKNIERRLGIDRPGLHDVDGSVAVLLWEDYRRRGNARALETLLAYNAHDVLNLHWLVIHAHNEYLKRTPFGPRHTLTAPVLPAVPFRPDAETVARVTGVRHSYSMRNEE